MRSAESWIGVSGFLISWASRRRDVAPGGHARVRTSGVTSSEHEDGSFVGARLPCRAWLGG